MNVLQLSKFYPPVAGGIETAAFELTEGLNQQAVRTDVLCAHTHWRTSHERRDGYDITRAGSMGLVLSTSMSPQLIGHLWRLRARYDVLHVHLPNPMATLAMWIAHWPGAVVLHWHSDIINQAKALRYYEPLQTWMLRRANAVIATSQSYAESSRWLRPWLSKVHVVPLGIQPDRYQFTTDDVQAERESLRRTLGGRPLVFSIGRMTSYKGFDHLIRAASLLREDAVVVIGGSGELLDRHRDQVRDAGLEGRVRFPGRLTETQVAAHLAEARAFCLPSTSRAEAFGMVLLEAMGAGLPIVASDIEGSGVPWVNRDGATGFNVPVGDAGALAEALDLLLRDPETAARLGSQGRVRLHECFLAEHMVRQTAQVYRSLG